MSKMNNIVGLEIPEEFPIAESRCTIGRARENNLVVADLSMSRNHCTIEKKRDQWIIKDTSANGIQVNTSIISKNMERPLRDGDVITLTDKINYIFRINSKANPEDKTAKLTRVHGDVQKVNFDDTVINLCDMSPQPPVVNSAGSTVPKAQSLSTSLDPMREELTCSICAEIFINATVLNCKHTFCSFCIATWRKNNNICPICRSVISREPVTSLVIDNCCKQVSIGLSEDERKKREEVIKLREVEEAKMSKQKKKGPAGRGRGRGRPSRQPAASRRQPASSRRGSNMMIEIEISSSDSDEDSDEMDLMLLQDALLGDFDDDMSYTGMPGRYYGGYGCCYICHQPGHWANGCPNR